MYEYPSDEVLTASVEEHGASWTARQLGIPVHTLSDYLRRRELPTKAKPRTLEPSDEMKQIAGLLK